MSPRLDDLATRCISAWAEEPGSVNAAGLPGAVHLRVGGGTRQSAGACRRARGASPRGRRNPKRVIWNLAAERCISAWAEEPPRSAALRTRWWVHLRVGGGTGASRDPPAPRGGASPRGRRNHSDDPSRHRTDRCISAWAEEPSRLPLSGAIAAVHLRVGGGTRVARERISTGQGASPRGRRNPWTARIEPSAARCISAWAEEPRRRDSPS